MLHIPILILLLTACSLWVARNSHPRLHWFIAPTGIFLSWVATIVLADRLPIELKFSIWEPQSLFPTDLAFRLDEISWPLMLASIATVFTAFTTSPAQQNIISTREQIEVLVYAVAGLGTVLSGNLLTVITIWMVADSLVFLIAILKLNQVRAGNGYIHVFVKNLASVFLLLLASGLQLGSGGSTLLDEPVRSTAAFIMILFASFLRIPIHTEEQYCDQMGWIDHAHKAIPNLFPVVAGIALIGRVIQAGIPEGSYLWMRILGCLLLVVGGLRLLVQNFSREKVTNLLFGVMGIGLLVASLSPEKNALIMADCGVIVLFIGSAVIFLKLHARWHSLIPIFLVATMVGMPGTIGNVLCRQVVDAFLAGKAIGIGLLVSLGLILLGMEYLRFSSTQREEWKSAETISQISYSSGWVLLVITAFMSYLPHVMDIEIKDIVYFLIMGMILFLINIGMNYMNMDQTLSRMKELTIPRFRIGEDLISQVNKYIIVVPRALGNLFEGETGMLWVFVILQLLILAIWRS